MSARAALTLCAVEARRAAPSAFAACVLLCFADVTRRLSEVGTHLPHSLVYVDSRVAQVSFDLGAAPANLGASLSVSASRFGERFRCFLAGAGTNGVADLDVAGPARNRFKSGA